MSPSLIMVVVVLCLMARRLVDLYHGGHYQCPACGARDVNRHSRNCPWEHD